MKRLSATRKALWAAVFVAAGAWLAVTAWSEYRQDGAVESVGTARQSAIEADFALTDHRGQPRRDEDFAGQWLLVFFGFTNCPDVCPLGLSTIADVMDGLGEDAGRVQPLFVSIDPERDTPAAMADYVPAFHPAIVGLTGSTAQVADAAESFHAYYEKIEEPTAPDGYTMSHSASIYLIGPDGAFIKPYSYNATPEEIAVDLKEQLES